MSEPAALPTQTGNYDTRYEQVARHLRELIANGTFQVGERLPSVRALRKQFQISISTTLEAYRLLEDQGLIEARPQSGHYVRPQFRNQAPIRQKSIALPVASEVNIDELTVMIYRDCNRPDFVPLGAAIPDPSLLPGATLARMLAREARQHTESLLRYEVPAGVLKLRKQISRRMMHAGCSVTPDDIIVTTGCTEALTLALRATCKPGDTVAVDSPSFFNTLRTIGSLGLRALEIPSDPVNGMNLGALQYALEHHPVHACLVVGNYSNPLGSLMPPASKSSLLQILRKHGEGIPLIEDDIYGDLHHGNERPVAIKSFDTSENVLYCASFSKTVAPGLRVGWIVPGRYYRDVERLKSVSSLTSAVIDQYAMAGFLEHGGYDNHLRKLRRALAHQTVAIAQSVLRYFPAGTTVSQPQGGFVLWVEMPEAVDSIRLALEAREAGISIAPGPLFSSRGAYKHCIRLNAAFWSESIVRAIAHVGTLAKAMLEGEFSPSAR